MIGIFLHLPKQNLELSRQHQRRCVVWPMVSALFPQFFNFLSVEQVRSKVVSLRDKNFLLAYKYSAVYFDFILMAVNIIEPTPEQLQQLETIQVNHNEAYLYVSQGLSCQEQHQYSLARKMYEKGLEKIDRALNIRCDRPYCNGPKWDEAREFQQKMRKTSQIINLQLRDIQNAVGVPISSDEATSQNNTLPEPFQQPPSYDEGCEHELIAAGCSNGIVVSHNSEIKGSSEAIELFSIQEEVLLFYVSADGSVSTTSNQSSLHIYQFIDYASASNEANLPPAWLQIGCWTYPLIPGQSPVFESGYGAFLFPNVSAGQDSAVGVILPPTVDAAQRSKFLNILNSLTAFREEKPVSTVLIQEEGASNSGSYSDTISRSIVTGAEYLSAGIVKGAAYSSDLIHQEASKARLKISPEDKPVVVDPRVKEGLKIARDASGVALKATGFLVRKLGELTFALGKQLAPHIKEQGSRLLSSALKKDQKEADETMDGVLTVAAGGLQGFSTIYSGLEQAARTLAYSLSTETVNIVGHKYGNEVGEVVGNAVFSIGNLALTTHNVQSLGIEAEVKRTAKDTGKAILEDYVDNEKKSEKQ